jgi:hypothetical protein
MDMSPTDFRHPRPIISRFPPLQSPHLTPAIARNHRPPPPPPTAEIPFHLFILSHNYNSHFLMIPIITYDFHQLPIQTAPTVAPDLLACAPPSWPAMRRQRRRRLLAASSQGCLYFEASTPLRSRDVPHRCQVPPLRCADERLLSLSHGTRARAPEVSG